jgi:hypothetical protein
MQHQIKEEGGKVQIDFRSVALQDTSFSMSMRVVTETIPKQELVGNFRASAFGDTLNTRVFLYPKGGFMNYQTRYGLMKTVPLPGKDGILSGYIFKDRALVYQFRELSAEEVSFNTHRVERSNENNRERAIRDPLETSEVSLEDFELNSETLEGSIISGELVVIGGEPVWIDQKNLPEEEQHYGSPVRLNLSGKEIGLADLPEEQSFPLSRKMQAFRYSLVDRNLQTIEVTVSEAPENYFIDIKRGDLEDLETKLHLIEFQETAGEYAETVKDFILYASENYRALNEKDIVWWKEQMESMNVELPDSDNTMDYFRAIEDKYELNNNVINAIAREYYRENYPEVEIAYSVIIASRSNRSDTTEHAHKLTNSAFEMDITLKSADWFGMSMELEDSLRRRYSDNLITWALESAGERLDPVSRFTMTSDLDGNIRKAGYLSPSGYDRLKINYMHKGDSTGISLSHPLQENEQRFFETGTGIWDVHYLLGFLPWFELEGKGSKSYYFIDTRGNTYGSSFYITPVFYRVNISQESEQTIEYMGRQIGTYKLRLTFNRPVERPSIFPSGLSMDDSLQPYAEIWLSTKKPHLPVKMQVKNEVYWRGPDPIDPKQSEEWFRWTGY